MNHREPPRISFVVGAYNHERFIQTAVESVLAQTYSPLEILFSDDCSRDRTFEIIKSLTRNYRGPHKVILNRNPQNLGIGRHLNRVMELATGDLIVGMAGDDASMPNRAERICKAFMDSGGRAFSIFSDMEYMDEEGKLIRKINTLPAQGLPGLERMIRSQFPTPIGAVHAWHRQTFDFFGPLPPDVNYEDRVIPFRSAALGELAHIPECLVRYRKHGAAFTGIYRTGKLADFRRTLGEMRKVYASCAADLRMLEAKPGASPADTGKLALLVKQELGKIDATDRIFSGKVGPMLGGYRQYTALGGSSKALFRRWAALVYYRTRAWLSGAR